MKEYKDVLEAVPNNSMAPCGGVKPSHPESVEYSYQLELLADIKNYYGWILEEIQPFFGQRLAEIGGGIGTFTELFVGAYLQRDERARLEVFEPTAALFSSLEQTLRSRYASFLESGRLKATAGYFEFYQKQQFDTIIMINVLEHISDDQEFIRNVFRSLPPGGTFVVYVPALQWLYGPVDKKAGHYRRYEKKALQRLFEVEGFEIAKVKYMDMGGILPWYFFHVVGGRESFNPFLAQLYDRWMVPMTRFVEALCGAILGKNLLIVGRKSATGRREEEG